jgi:antitoxin component of MazEF toxin-antitoxin module
MLKKLVKYGNSNALVLDKAIMELVGIEEGSVVKIKTDGTSLILTPHVPVVVEKINEPFTAEQATLEVGAKLMSRGDAALEKRIVEGRKQVQDLSEKLAKDPAYLEELKALAARRADMSQVTWLEQLKNLQYRYQPELKQAEADMCLMPSIDSVEQQNALDVGAKAFMDVHTKYQSTVIPKLVALDNDSSYQHERQLLAEKYQANLNSQEYMQALNELNGKYCPEYAEYIAEIGKVTKEIENTFGSAFPGLAKK